MHRSSDFPCPIEDFSNTVEVIYDCVLNPDRWREAVAMIAGICDSPMSSVNVFDFKTCQNVCLYDYGYTPDFWSKYEPYAAEHPLLPAARLMDVGDVTTIADSCGDEEFLNSRIYREFFKPMGNLDFIGLVALRSESRVGYLHACRTDTQPRYSDAQTRIFKLLAKHVCRAMKISDLFDLQTLKSEVLEATLDELAAGVFLIARDGRVVHMNRTAERQVRNGDALRLIANRLSPTDQAAGNMLASALAAVMDDEAEIQESGHAMALPSRTGEGLIATILPLERGNRRAISKPFTAAAAVFVQDPTVLPLFPGEAFAKLYGLTGGELRVAMAMMPGLAAQEAADMLGIGLQTVKTHLQHIFQKTGTSRQADLLALMSRSSVPIKTQ